MNEMISKINESIKHGDFFFKAANKLHSWVPIYWLSNKNLQFNDISCKTYKKYSKKYGSIVKEGVQQSKQEKSNIIWICWFQGFKNAPQIVKACVQSVKMAMPDRKIIILTNNNIAKYTNFPSYIVEKRKAGRISNAHFSDLLRAELLCNYGGMWIDSTVLCTTENVPSYIKDARLFVYKKLDTTNLDINPLVCSSWLISAYSNDQILLLTRKLLYQYWKDNSILTDYFLFHVFFAMSARRYSDEWDSIPTFDNQSPHVLSRELRNNYSKERWSQICRLSDFHKLDHHFNYDTDNYSFYKYILKTYVPNQ